MVVLGLDTTGTLWARRSCDCIVGSSLMEVASNHLGEPLPQVGRESFCRYKIFTRTIMAAFLCGGEVAIPTVQIHYNETRGYPEAEVEEESAYSTPVALDLSTPKSWRSQGQDVVSLGF